MSDTPARLTVRVAIAASGDPVTVQVLGRPRTASDPGVRFCWPVTGGADSAQVFGPLSTALGRRWTVVALDAPGHGGTPWPHGPEYSVPVHVTGATAVLDALPQVDRRRCAVVALGHAMGALTAAGLAAARPGVVTHLVLEDPLRTTPQRVPSTPVMRAWLRRLRDTDQAGRLAYLRREHPDWPADEHDPWARSKTEADVTHLQARVNWGESLVVLLSEVTCPVTLVHGDRHRGALLSRTAATRCAAVCAGGAEVVRLTAGHHPRREGRTAFVAALADVLDRYGDG